MLQITPQMKVLVAIQPADFRKGIDGLAALCKAMRLRHFGVSTITFILPCLKKPRACTFFTH